MTNIDKITDINIERSLKDSYLDYSMSVIVGRALPDARDGLKPVHRRILYAMSDLNLSHKAPYKKSARIVGDCIGKYHPHGDNAVYDALVRMAQSFSLRMTLIDGQGNFGSIDGDNAAAQRYTEARMTSIAEELLKDIDKDTVNFVANYDDSMVEPEVLPTRVPNILINGSSGIAVGMATNIPPHNLNELINGLIEIIDNKDATLSDIQEYIKGPDFPTGGIIFGKQGITDAFQSGKGRIKVRSKLHIEQNKNGRESIVVDELPYQVNKTKLIEQIVNLVKDKKIDGISDIRDDSDRNGISLVIELKKGIITDIVLNNLYKATNLEVSFSSNMIAIINKEPKLFNLMEFLNTFLSHRKSVIIRRTIFELQKAKARLHILIGLKVALEKLDDVISLIKSSADIKNARELLKDKYDLSIEQVNAILDMKLNKLSGLEIDKLEKEHIDLVETVKYLNSILKSEDILNQIIKDELIEIREKFPTPRQTEIVEDYEAISDEDLIPNEEMVITITHRGYIKRVATKIYEKQNRGGKGKTALTTNDDDFIVDFFTATNHNTLLIITDKGQLHWLKVYKIPEASRVAKGKAIVNLIKIEINEKIKSIIPTTDFNINKSLIFFTKNGLIKRTNLKDFSNVRSNGVRAILLDEDDELITVKIANIETKDVLIVTKNGQCVRFNINKTKDQGRSTRGAIGIRFKNESDEVVGTFLSENENDEVVTISEKGYAKRTEIGEYKQSLNKGGKGVIAMKLTQKTGVIVGVSSFEEDKDLMALTSSGKMVRVEMSSITKTLGRNTGGSRFINVGKDKVVTIAQSTKEVEEDESIEENIETSN